MCKNFIEKYRISFIFYREIISINQQEGGDTNLVFDLIDVYRQKKPKHSFIKTEPTASKIYTLSMASLGFFFWGRCGERT